MDDWEDEKWIKDKLSEYARLMARRFDEQNHEHYDNGLIREERKQKYVELMVEIYKRQISGRGGFYPKPTLYRPYNIERCVYVRTDPGRQSDFSLAEGSNLKKRVKKEK